MGIRNSRPKNGNGTKNDLMTQIRIAQSFLGYKISSINELKKEHINVLKEIFKGLVYDVNKKRGLK